MTGLFDAILLVVFPLAVAYGGASDFFTMTIPNRIFFILAAGFVAVASLTGLSVVDWGFHLAAFAVVFAAGFLMFALGVMGGGDVKFMSGIALWIGFGPVLPAFILLVCLFGLVLTVAFIVARTWLVAPETLAQQDWFVRLHNPKSGIPYGIAIAAAALQVYPATIWFAQIGQ